MSKLTFIAIFLLLVSCTTEYSANKIAPIVIIKLSDQVESDNQLDMHNLFSVMRKLDESNVRQIALKFSVNNSPADSNLSEILSFINTPVYSAATLTDEKESNQIEDDFFEPVALLLKRSFHYFKAPSELISKQFAGVGLENVTYRNTGAVESYYVISAINGKAFASLPLLMATDVLKIKRSEIPFLVQASQYGLLPIRHAEKGYYQQIKDTDLLSDDFDTAKLNSALILIYYGDDEIVTTAGVRNRAEITADVLNQLINRLSEN